MNRLFWKIFGWFFGTALLLVGLSLAVWNATRPAAQDPLSAFGLAAEAGRLAAGEPIRVDQIEAMKRPLGWLAEHGFDMVVFDGKGREMLRSRDDLKIDLAPLAKRSLAERATLAQTGPGQTLLLASPVGTSAVIVTAVPPRPRATPFQIDVLRWSVPVVASFILCLALARYLSAPVEQFRSATARLASGDLSVRVGPRLGARRDELADAGRDFDHMAIRIQRLIESERRLLGDISHELRSPLARLAVAIELERRGSDSGERPMLDRIEREAKRLDDRIGQVLTLARLRSGEAREQPEDVDLRTVAEEVAGDAEFEAHSRQCRIEVAGDAPVLVLGHRGLLRSAIENLVRNAVRYTPPGSDVSVSLERAGAVGEAPAEGLQIVVRDRGPGVPEEALPQLFEPFYRVDSSRDRGTGGTGLGLAIVRDVVDLHGGEVGARNAPDGGLEIRIALPRTGAAAPQIAGS